VSATTSPGPKVSFAKFGNVGGEKEEENEGKMGLNEKRNEGKDGGVVRGAKGTNEQTPTGGVNNNPSLLLSADGEKGAVMRDGTKTAADLKVVGAGTNAAAHHHHHHHAMMFNNEVGLADGTMDEIGLLERLIERTFDASKADAVFDKFKGKPPAWLEKIFRSERGRALLFKLADRHQNCLLIDLAIQHAWRAGLRREVRALGSAASAYFGVFHELMADHFTSLCENVLAAASSKSSVNNNTAPGELEEKIRKDTIAITDMCTRTVGAYMFAQILLSDIINGDEFSSSKSSFNSVIQDVAKRFSQDLEIAAAEKHGAAAVRRIATALSVTSEDADVASAISDLLQAAGKPIGGLALGSSSFASRKRLRSGVGSSDSGGFNVGVGGGSAVLAAAVAASAGGGHGKRALATWDLKKILGKYKAGENDKENDNGGRQKPSAAPLRRPDALRALFEEAFQYEANLHQLVTALTSGESENSPKALCVEILALATANDCYVQEDVNASRKDLLSALQICNQASKTFDNSTTLTNDDRKNGSGVNEKLSPSEFLEKCAELKTLSSSLPATAAVLTWIESAIRRDPEKSHKVAFALLETCVQSQPTLRLRALECVSTAIEVAGRGCGDDIPIAAIDVILSLFEDEKISSLENYEEFITDALDECVEVWTPNRIDQSHVKRFLSEFLEFAQPPYSRAFAVRVLSCLNACRAKKGFSQSIDVFLEEVRVKKREFRPSLGREAMDMLEAACAGADINNNNGPGKVRRGVTF
jgi:negative elongation factor C/D